MTAEAEILRLVQEADWTRLRLATETNDGTRVLLAPGRRFREQTADGLRGGDGERAWRMPGQGNDHDVSWTGAPKPPLPMLLCPAWLLRSSHLEVRGHVTACFRGPRRRAGAVSDRSSAAGEASPEDHRV